MKLIVWIGHQEQDSACYNVVAKTKKACIDGMEKQGIEFEGIYKVQIEVNDMFQLFDLTTEEGAGRSPYNWKIIKRYDRRSNAAKSRDEYCNNLK